MRKSILQVTNSVAFPVIDNQLFYFIFFARYSALFDSTCSCENIIKEGEEEKDRCSRQCTVADEQLACGGEGTESIYETGSRTSGAVRSLQIQDTSSDKITISFDQPERNGTELTGYEIIATVLKTYNNNAWALRNHTWKVQKSINKMELSNLISGTTYNITIISKNNDEDGGKRSTTATTKLAPPDPKPDPPKILEQSNEKVKIEVKRAINNNGPISKYVIVVQFVDNELLIHDFDESLLDSYQKAQEDGLSYYITGEIDAFQEETKTFTIGDGRRYGHYANQPLPKRHFHILVGVVSRLNNEERVSYSNSSHDIETHEILTIVKTSSSESSGSSDMMVVILTAACILCGLILIGSIAFYGYIRMKINPRMTRLERHEMSLQGPILEVDNNGFISDTSGVNFKEKLQEVLFGLDDDQKIARKNLSLDIDQILGMGSFGDVIKGQMNGNIPSQVHVVSPDDMDPPIQIKFIRDLNNLLQFGFHKNMINFLGICQTHDWFFVVFEETAVTLKQFLLSSRQETSSGRMTNLTEDQVLKFMLELAETMEYLAFNKIIHKNLNPYNVRIKRQNSAYTIKLITFGPTLYSTVHEGNRVMIDDERWFAPEVMRFQKYSTASDVWSFGLVLWEVANLGATSYGSIATSELLTRIKKGIRPDKTEFIYEDLYQLMLNCWETDTIERILFSDIVGHLKQLQSSPEYALNYNVHAQMLPYFLPLLEIKN